MKTLRDMRAQSLNDHAIAYGGLDFAPSDYRNGWDDCFASILVKLSTDYVKHIAETEDNPSARMDPDDWLEREMKP
jgi:hypothetical protein